MQSFKVLRYYYDEIQSSTYLLCLTLNNHDSIKISKSKNKIENLKK